MHLKRIQTYFPCIVRRGIIDYWDDTKLQPGTNTQQAIEQAITSASVATLLISAELLASDFIESNQLLPLLALARTNEVVILSTLLNYCLLDDTLFAPITVCEL